jgi:hypothetical protein
VTALCLDGYFFARAWVAPNELWMFGCYVIDPLNLKATLYESRGDRDFIPRALKLSAICSAIFRGSVQLTNDL